MDPAEVIQRELTTLFDSWRCDTRAVAAHIDPCLEPNGLLILAWLSDSGPARLTDIAQHYGVGKGTMSRQLKALEGLGLVERRESPDDARAVLFGPTDRARKELTHVWSDEWEWRRAQFATWDPDDVATLAALLERFNAMSAS
ncbi:MarR family winged helix-turn-helix transcriptional regulator [Streptomyces sp. HNM0574]|uniref:MarR family winged helix-turn-helix transcriptional regulator n=1 Tax=Streptomyces sp. HNM0574 TaxID=2714954 RepID=UPI00146B4018|nr:MarR family winged helix-turn-helix transcriptional regulator [Streptomyces sp. HNM0574]NLU69433.1 winged helix-turn-helix transcriptional regulator [Streptomyces sp. HNM0574]